MYYVVTLLTLGYDDRIREDERLRESSARPHEKYVSVLGWLPELSSDQGPQV